MGRGHVLGGVQKKPSPRGWCRLGIHQREYVVKRCATGLSELPSVAEAVELPSL
jgi:hypothetical protein